MCFLMATAIAFASGVSATASDRRAFATLWDGLCRAIARREVRADIPNRDGRSKRQRRKRYGTR